MSHILDEIFGSDLEGDQDEMRRDLGGRREKVESDSDVPKQTAEEEAQSRKPVSFSDSDNDDEEPMQRRGGIKRKPKRSDDDRSPARSPRKRASISSEEDTPRRKKVKHELDDDDYSSDDEDERRERERERKRRLKKKESTKKRVKTERDYDRDDRDERDDREDDVERDELGWRKKPKQEEYDEDVEEDAAPKPEKPKTAFEAAMEETKSLRRPRKKEIDPATIEAECVLFLEKMMKARDADITAYKAGRPALNKLKMLREVELMVMKVSHREYLMDNMLLALIKAWLDPMSDGALPNLQIRATLLTILNEMRVDDDWIERLQESQGLGKLIHFLSRAETNPANKRIASKIMMKWARPVYRSNSNYHDLLDEFDKPEEGRRAPKDGIASERKAAWNSMKNMQTTQEKLDSFKTTTGKTREQVLAAVPQRNGALYTRLAESDANLDLRAVRETRNTKARNKKVNRTMSNLRRLNKRNTARAAKPSVNGRNG